MNIRSLKTACSLLFVVFALSAVQPAAAAITTDGAPPSANDVNCKPSATHPRPVVLVHGLWSNMQVSWASLSPLLASKGYCVFALNYGAGSVGLNAVAPMEQSATELSTFIDQVLTVTGASQVDIVGHSEGGLMPRWYLAFGGGAAKVHTLVTIDSPHHGTTVDGLITLAQLVPGVGSLVSQGFASWCPACVEFINGGPGGSTFLSTLNAGGDTVPGVKYTAMMSTTDLVVSPTSSALLTGANVTNLVLQNQCPTDVSNHLTVVFDTLAQLNVLNALDPVNAKPANCFSAFYL